MADIATVEKDTSLPFLLFDKLDDDLIKAELEGKIPDILTYHFVQDGQEVWGISKPGVDECVRQLARKGEVIREISINFTETETDFLFTATSARYAVNAEGREIQLDTRIGLKRQPKYYKSKDGKPPRLNPFAFEQGGMKALRNANRRLIPPEIEAGVIAYAKQHGKVKEVKPSNGATMPSEAPKTPQEATLRQEIRSMAIDLNNDNMTDKSEEHMNKVKKEASQYLFGVSGYKVVNDIPVLKLPDIHKKVSSDYKMAFQEVKAEELV